CPSIIRHKHYIAIKLKKPTPPFHTIDSFRSRKHVLDCFDMMRLESDLHEIGYALKPHSHDCCLVLIITRGGGLHTVDGENYKVEPNCIFLLIPGQIHSF